MTSLPPDRLSVSKLRVKGKGITCIDGIVRPADAVAPIRPLIFVAVEEQAAEPFFIEVYERCRITGGKGM